jgi:hypothetical protein
MLTQPVAVDNEPRPLSFRDIERLSAMAGSLTALAVRKAGNRWPSVAEILGREYAKEHGSGHVAMGELVLALLCEWEVGP